MSEQNFANHRTQDKALIGIAVLYLAAAIIGLLNVGALGRIVPLLIAVASLWLIFRVRAYATRLQDRIIRQEMRLRLAGILPAELAGRIGELEVTHLIGLRFASDAELPELVTKVLNNKSMRSKDIKPLIKNWQGDYFRV